MAIIMEINESFIEDIRYRYALSSNNRKIYRFSFALRPYVVKSDHSFFFLPPDPFKEVHLTFRAVLVVRTIWLLLIVIIYGISVFHFGVFAACRVSTCSALFNLKLKDPYPSSRT